jgi:hypothetical protein
VGGAERIPCRRLRKTNLPAAEPPIGGSRETKVNMLKLIGLTFIQLVKQAWLLPQNISGAVKERQQRNIMRELEAERLDRIRNPSKYLGK